MPDRLKTDLFPPLLAGAVSAPASAVPPEIMSDGLPAVARALPLTHVVTLLKGMWLGWAGQTWLPSSIVLFALLIITGVGAIRWFKWDATSSRMRLVSGVPKVSLQNKETEPSRKESRMKKLPVWAHYLLAALGSNFLTLLATTVIISGYAIGLGFQARGMPDVNQISAFADQIAPMATLVLLSAFTLIAGWSVAGRNLDQAILFGFLVGLAVVVLRFVMALAIGSLSLNSMTFITIGAALVAGLSGGVLHQVTNDR